MPWAVAAAAVGAAGSYMSSSASSSAAKKASQTQQASATQASAQQQAQFEQAQKNLAPYRQLGTDALSQISPVNYANTGQAMASNQYNNSMLQQAYGEMPTASAAGTIPDAQAYRASAPGGMSQQELEQTPGYQFTRDQGLQSVQSSAAARGLGVSGAALKGAATFATGLADKTYQDQFAIKQQQFANQGALFGAGQTQFGDTMSQNAQQFGQQQSRQADLINLNTGNQTNLQGSYSRLSGLATIGQNSANSTGTLGQAAASASGNYLTSGASAAAAGQIAQGNATASGYNGLTNAVTQYAQGRSTGFYKPSGIENYLFGNGAGGGSGGGNGSYGAVNAPQMGDVY